MRHSRKCDRTNDGCTCIPTYQAWIYEDARKKKRRKTFPTYSEALAWRVNRLRALYRAPAYGEGKIDRAYALLRRASQELDRVLAENQPSRHRALIRDALDACYVAEDAVLTSMRESITSG